MRRHSVEQDEKIEKFFQDFYAVKNDEKQILQVVACLLAGLYAFFMAIPFAQEIRKDGFDKEIVMLIAIVIGISTFADYLYVLPYVSFRKGQERVRIYDRLKYLPIDTDALRRVQIRYLFRFGIKIFMAGFVVQLSFLVLIYGTVFWENVVYVITTGFVFPMLVNLSVILLENRIIK